MDAVPGALLRPPPEVFGHRLPGGQIVRQQAPRTAAAQHIQNALQHLPHVHGAGSAAGFGGRQQRGQEGPLFVGEVAGV